MYLNFYGFRKEPFHITPDPEFLFLSQSHREALGSIIYGIEKKKGFVSITGAVGVGKTTILRSYLERVDRSKIRAIYVFNPNVSFRSLLKTIHQELDIDVQTDDVFEMVNLLHYALIEEYKKGKNVVLVIDEAQNTPLATLENLRMLSNLETSKEKLIQMVLIGQPEFDRMLSQPSLRQMNQRIAIRSVIQPLTPKESREYIAHRLSKVTQDGKPVFTRGALRQIIKGANGIPRTLNILCDNALITGFGSQKNPVTARIAREVVSDMGGGGRKISLPVKAAAAGAVIAVAGGLFWLSPYAPPAVQNPVQPPIQSQPPQVAVPIQTFEMKLTEMRTPEPKPPELKPMDTGVSEPSRAETKNSSVVRVVKRGDNLSNLASTVYGFCDQKTLDQIKSYNPVIKNIHRIMIGDEILFPELDLAKRTGPKSDSKKR